MFFDIETLIPVSKGFPKPESEMIICIGIILHSLILNEEIKIILQMNTCNKLNDCTMRNFKFEIDMINEFEEIVKN